MCLPRYLDGWLISPNCTDNAMFFFDTVTVKAKCPE